MKVNRRPAKPRLLRSRPAICIDRCVEIRSLGGIILRVRGAWMVRRLKDADAMRFAKMIFA